MRFALLTVMGVFMLSACQNKVVIGKMKLSPSEACPSSFARYNCAPTPDESLLLTKFQPALPIVNGSPRWLDYVGGVIRDNDRIGSDPQYCGMKPFPAFRIDDLDVDLVPYNIIYERTLSDTVATTASVDLVAALRKLGVPEEKIQGVSAKVEGVWNRRGEKTVKTNARYVAVKISTPTMNDLRSDRPSARLEHCYAQMISNKYFRLIRAISGYWVKSASEDVVAQNDLIFALSAALGGILTEEQILGISPEINRIARSALNTASGEHFIVTAMTFYNPVPVSGGLRYSEP
jgi:hypothetical protein